MFHSFVRPGARLATVAGAVILLALLAGCGATATTSGMPPLNVTIAGTEMKFTPTDIRVAAGQKVVVNFENKGATEHDLNFVKVPASAVKTPTSAGHSTTGHSSSDIHAAVKAGASATLEFVAKEKGSYEFVCTVPGHKDAGMRGKLIVE